jgi:hypothetical protein
MTPGGDVDVQPSPDYDQPFGDGREELARQLFMARGYRAVAWDEGHGWDSLRRDCRYLIDRMWPAILQVRP